VSNKIKYERVLQYPYNYAIFGLLNNKSANLRS
jgi:hypothetical protein